MANLFIFGIGGTGSRVIRSLTHLLAAGVKIKADKVIPIVIDPDQSNGDLNRTFLLLNKYISIKNQMQGEAAGNFFNSHISSLDQLAGNQDSDQDFRMSIRNANNLIFQNFIDYPTLGNTNKDFINLFFSQDNLNAKMDIGFKGNPNMGSIVLNQLFSDNTSGMMKFASNFKQGDRIFIISSIFGGTGAAGFPLLVKNFRNFLKLNIQYPNAAFVSNAKIGALTVMPYFGVLQDTTQTIDKKTFVSKTKAALSYYERTINNKVNALYYIGDTDSKDYKNNPGAAAQENDAHFVELAGALAIIHFMKISDNSMPLAANKFFEFGTNGGGNVFKFGDLDDDTQKILKEPLTKMMLFKRYFDERYKKGIKTQPWAKRGKIKLKNTDVKKLKEHLILYEKWLNEMKENVRSFKPFNLINTDNLKDLVADKSVDKRKYKWYDSDHFVDFDRYLNKHERASKELGKLSKLINVFDNACEEHYNAKYK